MAHALGAFITIEEPSKSPLSSLPAVVHKPSKSNPSTPGEYELDQIQWGRPLTGPSTGNQTPTDLDDLERSAPATPGRQPAVDIVQSWNRPSINKWRLLAACSLNLANGFNDGAQGALLPYIEKHYSIGYAVVSLMFVTQALGFILAAPVTHLIDSKLGRSRGYMLAAAVMILAYIVIICQPPFWAIVAVYPLNGFGIALNLALNQVWVTSLVNSTTLLGALHGAYGIGATAAPLLATAMVSNGVRWSFYYFFPMALQGMCLVGAGWLFRDFENESSARLLSSLQRTASGNPGAGQPTKRQLLLQAFRTRVTLLGSLFIFAYQGSEVAISGWVITFFIKYRNGDPSSIGYVTAGFWAGITLGRFGLSHIAHKIGEKTSVVGLTIGAIAFQLLVWLVPNVIGEAVALSIVGLLLGPIYPCATAVYSKILTREMQMSSLSIISAFGSSGGAVVPFVTGLLSQKFGTVVLHPITIGLFVVMEITWLSLPKIPKRKD